MQSQEYDIIIIGTGAGGGTLAYHLAPSGKKILLLERGDFLPREKENWDSKSVFLEGKYTANEPWIDKQGKQFHPGIHYFVGGNTKMYGAALLRMREKDFEELKHYEGLSPAWPISYRDLEPYYSLAEKIYSVHGDRNSDPTEPPSSTGYPYPPIKHEPRIQKLANQLERNGYHPFPLPMGLILKEDKLYDSPCIKCNTCDGFPCLVDGKADSHIACIVPALKHPNVQLLTNTYVEKLETSSSGKEISRVIAKREGKIETFKGKIIVVACGAINSAALLLRSKNDHFPQGLANRSDVVGRFYMCHNNSALVAISIEKNLTKFQKTLGINDFYFGDKDFAFPLGHIQMLGKADKSMFRADAPFFVPDIFLEKMAEHSIDFWLTTEDLPDPNNRVTISSNGNIQLTYTENNTFAHKMLIKRLKKMLKETVYIHHIIDCRAYLGKKIPLAGVAHQNGTIRFGKDPKTSALDTNCKAHDLDNLYVVDGSFFVSSSSVNPSLTIIANALRVGDHLLERFKS